MGTSLGLHIPTHFYAWILRSSFILVICCWLAKVLLCCALQVLVSIFSMSLGRASGCFQYWLLDMCVVSLKPWFVGSCVLPIAASVSDTSIVVCYPSAISSTGHCISSFVLVFLVMFGNLLIGLSPGTIRWHSFILSVKRR